MSDNEPTSRFNFQQINNIIKIIVDNFVKILPYDEPINSYNLKHILENKENAHHEYVSNGKTILACFILGIQQNIPEDNLNSSICVIKNRFLELKRNK